MNMTLNLEEHSLIDKIKECLTQQVSELELLKSMYPKQDEIVLTDHNALENIEKFLHDKSEHMPNHLDFVVNMYKDDHKFEISIDLPSLYPFEEPDIHVRCNQLNRQQETLLNRQLIMYTKNNHFGEVCLYTAISWLQENADFFINYNSPISSPQNNEDVPCSVEDKFVRMWIYSHHIYNKKKREDIIKLAKKLHLTGFCLPGKPGIVCIEGPSIDCLEWWKDIKSMNWQKIVLKFTEVFEVTEQQQMQKFYKFEELEFNKSSRNDKHQDMSAFSRFMEERGLTNAFNECFGFDVGQDLNKNNT